MGLERYWTTFSVQEENKIAIKISFYIISMNKIDTFMIFFTFLVQQNSSIKIFKI